MNTKELLVKIAELLHIINSPERLMEVIREELEQVRTQFADERRTEITAASGDIDLEDLIAQEDVVVTFLTKGYVNINRLPTTKHNVVVVKVNPQRR